MGGEKSDLKFQLRRLALFLFPNACAKKNPFQLLLYLLLSGGELSATSRALPHHATPPSLFSEHF